MGRVPGAGIGQAAGTTLRPLMVGDRAAVAGEQQRLVDSLGEQVEAVGKLGLRALAAGAVAVAEEVGAGAAVFVVEDGDDSRSRVTASGSR